MFVFCLPEPAQSIANIPRSLGNSTFSVVFEKDSLSFRKASLLDGRSLPYTLMFPTERRAFPPSSKIRRLKDQIMKNISTGGFSL